MEQDILNNYKQAAEAAANEAEKYKKLANTYSLLRLGIFGLMIFAIYLTITRDTFTIMAVAFVVLLFGFAWLVSRQSGYESQRDYYLDLQKINENEIAGLTNGGNLYDNGQDYSNDKHFYTSDLDVFGNNSLFHLINRAATSAGNDKLAAWLNAPADKDTILLRQEAVEEISAKNDWKVNTQTKLLFANKEDTDQMKRLFIYLSMPLNLPGEKWLSIYIKIAPYLLFGVLIVSAFYPVFTLVATAIAFFNMFILVSKGSYILKAGAVADKIGAVLANYAVVFKAIENNEWQSKRCLELNGKLQKNKTSKNIEELSKFINKLGYSLIMIVGFVLNVFFLWALKQIINIENWKRDNHTNLEEAFDVIAEFEALISIAVPAINYPEWTFPLIADTEGYTLTAKNIAHPLIRSANRVANNYELEDAYHIDIITGSNMAGKSTFLRTVGINTVLALAGAPVCASHMQVSVITIVSYMRIKDSLKESTSTFKAELDRLQMLLAAVSKDSRVFFLIDEMLRGTNSVDKYLGSKAVIEQLISKRGVGMVATHDLQIARLEDKYPAYVRNFYFDIQVQNGEMLFDYKIKHGECKTFNASLLLKQIGINVEEEE
ncbi:MutS-related protein [Mucilaginibacter segetis]|uniref:DNA mismatch repair protein MutS n=1 Tax=Mucilaginibacter segetis TaxID=2793071 RepID=A0A934UNL5_9SPHI|nr:DNA mismatch repair protein MutS [Mucilaginibacter segetis]MBK0380544.1 DNA mismatch repair protein MutS [Mucilaginibacter segetis]